MTFLNPSHQDAGSLDPYPFRAVGRPGELPVSFLVFLLVFFTSVFLLADTPNRVYHTFDFHSETGTLMLVCSLGCAQCDGGVQ